MTLVSTIARYLLGLFFTLFGLNGFIGFIPIPPKPDNAMQFMHLLETSHYMVAVFAVQLAGGLILLSGRYVPLGLTLLGPVLVNILLFHVSMDPTGIGPGVFATVCWCLVFYGVFPAFSAILQPRVGSTPSRSFNAESAAL